MAINYKLNNRYFKSSNSKTGIIIGIIFIIAGIIMCLSGGDGLIGGVIVTGIGIIVLVIINKSIIKGAMIDKQCAEEIVNIKEKALKKLGIDEEQVSEAHPILFDGYLFSPKWNVLYKEEDSIWRTSNYQASIFFFSAEQVYYYAYTFSLIDAKHSEDTEEYFYTDIVSVATKSEEVKIGSYTKTYEVFNLTTSGGTSIQAAFTNVEDVEQSVREMRALLRQKKSTK